MENQPQITDLDSVIHTLIYLGIRGVAVDPDQPGHAVAFYPDGDPLWINEDGSYVRKHGQEHRDAAAFVALRWVRHIG